MSQLQNYVRLTGRVGALEKLRIMTDGNPSIRLRLYLPSASAACRSRTFGQTVIAWDGIAELIHRTVHKNDRLFIEGHLRNRSFVYQGQTHLRTEVVVDHFHRIASECEEPHKSLHTQTPTNPSAA